MRRLLFFLATAACAAETWRVPPARLEDQIRGGLLGHILGDLNGLKHEMKYILTPGDVASYTPELSSGAFTDDDTDVEWVYVLEMERSRTLLVPPARIADLWRRHINRRIWCSHLYLRQLLDLGIEPPLTGSVHLNPWASFNLSGQFVSESWGLISPGMPRTAARIARHYTRVSVDGEPIQAAQMFAAMIATAFRTSDVDRILDAGLAATDPASEMRRAALDARRFHRDHPSDWRATRRLLKEKYMKYGGQDMRDRNGVLLNGSATVAALLYGKGDFVQTVRTAFTFGWDADNNAATSGCIVGVIKGWRWMMAQGWSIRDEFRNTSRDEMPMDETITRFGDRLVRLAEQNIQERGGSKTAEMDRVKVETPSPIERLLDPAQSFAELRRRLGPETVAGVERGSTEQERARAAYLAICLDRAAELQKRSPEAWGRAIEALNAYPRVLQVIFYQSGPAGAGIREKAEAAGLRRPAAAERF